VTCSRRIAERKVAGRRHHRGARRRVGSGRVEHHAHPHRPEERGSDPLAHSLRSGHVGATDEDRRRSEVGTPAGKHRAVHEGHGRSGSHAAVPQEHLGPGIDSHHRIERARLRVAIKLDQNPLRHRVESFGKERELRA
jgi:hypothetical protein